MKLTPIKTKVSDMQAAVSTGRENFIGGSDAGTILGLNPYQSAYTLWARKTGRIPSEIPDNDAMRAGRDLEEYVAKRFEEYMSDHDEPVKVQRDNHSYHLEEYPFMVAHIDRRIVGRNAILECKTANSFQLGKYHHGDFPDTYYAQCMHYMACTGADRCYLAVFCFPHLFVTYYDRDEDEIEALIEAESDFWNMCKDDIPPAIDGSDSTKETISAMYPENRDDLIELNNPEVDQLVTDWFAVKDDIKGLESTKSTIENRIKELIGEHDGIMCNGSKATWKVQSRTSLDAERLKQEMPKVYEAYTKTTNFRMLKGNKKK